MKPARLARYGDFVLVFPMASGRLTVTVPKMHRYFDITSDNFEKNNTYRIVGTWQQVLFRQCPMEFHQERPSEKQSWVSQSLYLFVVGAFLGLSKRSDPG